ncbi:unnamed protein product [Boreogadus saida]
MELGPLRSRRGSSAPDCTRAKPRGGKRARGDPGNSKTPIIISGGGSSRHKMVCSTGVAEVSGGSLGAKETAQNETQL